LGFGSSSEVAQAPSRRLEALVSQSLETLGHLQVPISDASLEVLTPSAFPRSEQRHDWVEPASLDRQRLQVFATSWRFHPPRACRPCFMPDPLLGPPSRAFFLPRSR
jgi:hypothetical protein